MKLTRLHSLLIFLLLGFLLGCSCANVVRQEGNFLTGLLRSGVYGEFASSPNDSILFQQLAASNITTWPPQRKLLSVGRYGSSTALFWGGDTLALRQPALITLLHEEDQVKGIYVNVTLAKDECGLWQLAANKLDSKLYAFTQVQDVPEFRLYEVHPATGGLKLLATYKHDLPASGCWGINGRVAINPYTQEMLLMASANSNLWETWRISLRAPGTPFYNQKIEQSMIAPVLSRDLKTIYTVGQVNSTLVFQAIDATKGVVIQRKHIPVFWTVQRNVAALDEESGIYVVSAKFGGPPHLLFFDVNTMDLQASPFGSYRSYDYVWDLLFVPVN